jgi:hypothetical protein
MDFVVTRQYLTVSAYKLRPLKMVLAITHGNGKPTTQDDDLVAASHGDQKARRLFRQSRCQVETLSVVTHKGKVFWQSDQLGATTRR